MAVKISILILLSFALLLHYPLNWNQLVAPHNLLKHEGYYTFQLIDGICWIFSISLSRFFFHAEYDSFIFTFN